MFCCFGVINDGWIGYTGDGFYRSEDPTDSIKVLKEHAEYTINRKIQ